MCKGQYRILSKNTVASSKEESDRRLNAKDQNGKVRARYFVVCQDTSGAESKVYDSDNFKDCEEWIKVNCCAVSNK